MAVKPGWAGTTQVSNRLCSDTRQAQLARQSYDEHWSVPLAPLVPLVRLVVAGAASGVGHIVAAD